MNVKIKFETMFTAGVHWLDKLYMTNYTVKIKMLINSADIQEQNIAMHRLKCMLQEQFSNSVFVNQTNQKQIKQYLAAGVSVSPLPEEPLDQIIGIMLFCKLNAVMEERLFITSLDLSSEIGDLIVYTHSEGEAIGPFASEGWWHSEEPIHNEISKYAKRINDERIVEMQKKQTWKDYGFHWDYEETPIESTVVYADFPRKHEDQ